MKRGKPEPDGAQAAGACAAGVVVARCSAGVLGPAGGLSSVIRLPAWPPRLNEVDLVLPGANYCDQTQMAIAIIQ